MSELITNRNANIRLSLLATTSVFALAACVAPIQEALAADRPTVWIEGGWQFENLTGSSDTLVPPLDGLTTTGFTSVPTAANFLGQGAGGFPSFTNIENALGKSSGAEASISFQPKGSEWIFNISARYGRTHSRKHISDRADIFGEQVYTSNLIYQHVLKTPHYTNYVEQSTDNTEAHTIIDFKVGRDVGLGLFGSRTESVLSVGARYAQINITSKGHSYAAPAARFYGHGSTFYSKYLYNVVAYHQNSATIVQRYSNLEAIGPSLSWDNTTGLWGSPADGQVTLDWGVNAAVLFGRQKAKVSYSTEARLAHGTSAAPYSSAGKSGHRTQSRRVVVPNLGGFAGLSFRFINAKVSAGYRADFFFGALDRGLDTRRSMTTGYNGPYATVSIGLGQ